MHLGTQRHLDIQVFTTFAGAIAATTTFTAFSLETPREAKIGQGIEIGVPNQIDTAAITAVTAIRTTEFDVFFAPFPACT
jgi:hypothetical protein